MIPYARQSIVDADVAAVAEVLRSDFLTQGPAVPRFENAVAAYVGAKHAVAMTNATSALHVAMLALGVGPGDLVWTSPNSFVASANCAIYCGADVDFVDVDPRTYNLSVAVLREKLGAARAAGRVPKAVVAVDFAGQPCDFDAIGALREEYGFALVDDASHAIGAGYRGRRIGGLGDVDATVFSFHPVKIITTAEGGMLVTARDDLAARARLLRSHGITRDATAMRFASAEPWEYEMVALGFNYRLTDLQAALGLAQLARIDAMLAARRRIASRYDDALAGLPLTIPYRSPDAESALHLYPVVVHPDAPLDRRGVYDVLRRNGIAPNVHYIPIYLQPFYRDRGFEPGYCPVSETYYAGALSLPMYADLREDAQAHVIAVLRSALGR